MRDEPISREQYERERAICTAAEQYAERIMSDGGPKRVRNYLTKEEASAPVYAACDNDMRGRVEHFEVFNEKPEKLFAYYSLVDLAGNPSGYSAKDGDALRGCYIAVSVWTGRKLGTGRVTSFWRSNMGDRRAAFRVVIDGAEYSGTAYLDAGDYARLRKLKTK